MDIEKFQQFASANLSQYFLTTIETLTRPGAHFAPVTAQASDRLAGVSTIGQGNRLTPQLMAFAALSMFLGITLNSLITKRPGGNDLFQIQIAGLLFWALYAAMVHGFCKLARGRGSFHETASVTIQILATLYVVSSAAATALAMIMLLRPIRSFISGLGSLGELVAENPVVFFFLIHTILLIIYLPRGLKAVHGFGITRQIAVSLPTSFIILLHGVAMFILTGDWFGVDPSR
jgi:hypothetical protein